MSRLSRFAAVLALVSLAAVPVFAAARGTADFTRFVVVSDSYGAGLSAGSLNANHQAFSWPAIIARQAGVAICTPTSSATENCFAQPLVSFPGIGPENVLTDLAVVGGSIVPTITPAAGLGSPMMLTFGRPYNNLSVPGERVIDVATVTGAEKPGVPTGTIQTFSQFILRGQGSQVDQALALKPTFIASWIGGNDVLGAVTVPRFATPASVFTTAYTAMLDKLIAGAPGAGIVVGTLPAAEDATRFPNWNLIPPVVTDTTGKPVLINGNPIPLVGYLENGTVGPLPTGTRITLGAKADLAQGYGMPKVPPFSALPHAGEPLPDSDSITPAEMAILQQAITDYNAIIMREATARNIPVADIAGLFHRVFAGQEWIGPFNVTSAFLTGGFFSTDGLHLTDLGYTLFANEYIKTINQAYNTHIPLASITTMFADNGAFYPKTSSSILYPGMAWAFSTESATQLKSLLAVPAPTATQTPRYRAIHH